MARVLPVFTSTIYNPPDLRGIPIATLAPRERKAPAASVKRGREREREREGEREREKQGGREGERASRAQGSRRLGNHACTHVG